MSYLEYSWNQYCLDMPRAFIGGSSYVIYSNFQGGENLLQQMYLKNMRFNWIWLTLWKIYEYPNILFKLSKNSISIKSGFEKITKTYLYLIKVSRNHIWHTQEVPAGLEFHESQIFLSLVVLVVTCEITTIFSLKCQVYDISHSQIKAEMIMIRNARWGGGLI